VPRRRDESLDAWCTRVVAECADARRVMVNLKPSGEGESETARRRLDAAQADVLLAFEAWRLGWAGCSGVARRNASRIDECL
jgi:hypothetical protein